MHTPKLVVHKYKYAICAYACVYALHACKPETCSTNIHMYYMCICTYMYIYNTYTHAYPKTCIARMHT